MRTALPLIAALSLGFAVAVTWLLTPSGQVTAPPNQPARSTLEPGRIAGLGIVEPRSELIAVGSRPMHIGPINESIAALVAV